MSELSKQALKVENNQSFPNNNAGLITPSALRTFNEDMIDSTVNQATYTTDSASFDSRINAITGSGGTTPTGSLLVTASFDNGTRNLTFTKGDSSTFAVNIPDVSGSVLPSGVVSGSSQIILQDTTGNLSGSRIDGAVSNATNAVSSSYAVTASFALNVPSIPTGSFATTGSNTFVGNQIITGSVDVSETIKSQVYINSQTLDGFTIPTDNNAMLVGPVAISGSVVVEGNSNLIVLSQVTSSGTTSLPSGVVSGSSQIDYPQISNIPAGIVSGSSQLTASYDLRYALSGSGGGTIDTGSFATTGSNTFTGTQTISGTTSNLILTSSGGQIRITQLPDFITTFEGGFIEGINGIYNNGTTFIISGSDYWERSDASNTLIGINGSSQDLRIGYGTPFGSSNYTHRFTSSSVEMRGDVTINASGNGGNQLFIQRAAQGAQQFLRLGPTDNQNNFAFIVTGSDNDPGQQVWGINVQGGVWQNGFDAAVGFLNNASFRSGLDIRFGGGLPSSRMGVNHISESVQVYTGLSQDGMYIVSSSANERIIEVNPSNSTTTFRGTQIITGSVFVSQSLYTSDLYVGGNKQFNGAQYLSTISQSGSAAVSQSVVFDTTGVEFGVSLVSGSQLTLTNNGVYNIQFSVQLLADTGADNVWVWFKKNGTNIANSATEIALDNNAENVITVNVLEQCNANDYIEIAWESLNGDAILYAQPASGNRPAVPSIITTITQVR